MGAIALQRESAALDINRTRVIEGHVDGSCTRRSSPVEGAGVIKGATETGVDEAVTGEVEVRSRVVVDSTVIKDQTRSGIGGRLVVIVVNGPAIQVLGRGCIDGDAASGGEGPGAIQVTAGPVKRSVNRYGARAVQGATEKIEITVKYRICGKR